MNRKKKEKKKLSFIEIHQFKKVQNKNIYTQTNNIFIYIQPNKLFLGQRLQDTSFVLYH